MADVSDQIYFGVPTLTKFKILRKRIPVEAVVVDQTGQRRPSRQTGERSLVATLTVFQPVYKRDADGKVVVENGAPVVSRYLNLGDDEVSYLGAEGENAAEGQPPKMDDILDADTLDAIRTILIDVSRESVPDFAEQSAQMQAVGVRRYFHLDVIDFSGTFEAPSEATLSVVFGVYADAACTKPVRYVQQEFLANAKLKRLRADLAEAKATWTSADELITSLTAIIADGKSTVEQRNAAIAEKADAERRLATAKSKYAATEKSLDAVQPLSVVFGAEGLKDVLRSLTEALLEDAVDRNPAYAGMQVPAVLGLFDSAFDGLAAAISAE